VKTDSSSISCFDLSSFPICYFISLSTRLILFVAQLAHTKSLLTLFSKTRQPMPHKSSISPSMPRDEEPLSHARVTGTRTIKRKRSREITTVRYLRQKLDSLPPVITASSPLVDILREYGVLNIIASYICADDLLALLLTSKALHEAIMPRPASLKNLLGQLSCSGKGIKIRSNCHRKSSFFELFGCTEYVQCGSITVERSVETKPCASCNVATCDECRIHCVYQTIYQAPSDPSDSTELPCFSGFALLEPDEQPILSPHHLPTHQSSTIPHWQDASAGSSGPYHDQGYLDVPLEMDAAAPPESIETLLDLNLGRQSLMLMSEDSRYEYPSPVLSSICRVVDARKIFLCDKCFEDKAPNGPAATIPTSDPMVSLPWLSLMYNPSPIKACDCTLRARFLDRWLCLRCYQSEDQSIQACVKHGPEESTRLCRCLLEARRVLCLWCWGEVTEEDAEHQNVDLNRDTNS
jgi:hypothetical protein